MRRLMTLATVAAAITLSSGARAERLEIGLAGNPTWLFDHAYEAFSQDDLYLNRFGVDLRSEVGAVHGFAFAPFVGYRFGRDDGMLTWDIDTTLVAHDIYAGLRVRKALLSWLSVFAEVQAGAVIATMGGDIYSGYDYDSTVQPKDTYTDSGVTWNVGALLGVEAHISRRWLEARGTDWFCVGGEIGIGYIRRGDLTVDPELSGGGSNGLDAETLGDWGEVNLSGLALQFGASLYFI